MSRQIRLNEKQKVVVEAVKVGHHVFITGPGGTGKSTVIREIVTNAHASHKKVAVTAMTGAAALLIQGRTLHSFLGIGLGKKSVEQLVSGCKKATFQKLKKLDLLIIDEVSMLDSILFRKISNYLSEIRDNGMPFGGVQMILCGDLFQLGSIQGTYFFQDTELYDEMQMKAIALTYNHRQESDALFQEILGHARMGTITQEHIDLLKKESAPLDEPFESGIKPTRLFAINVDVDGMNDAHYSRLIEKGAEKRVYTANYSNENAVRWGQSMGIKPSVELCVGSQVVLKWNVCQDDGLVNGTRGVVVAVDEDAPSIRLVCGRIFKVMPIQYKCDDDKKIHVTAVPLRLAFAITIHGSQGSTLDAIEIDIGSSIFAAGQAYVALSRARSLKSVRIRNISIASFKVDPVVVEFYRTRVENNAAVF